MIPVIDLAAQHRALALEIQEAIARVFERSEFILGDEVAAFEEEFAAFCGVSHAVAVNSGTSALHLVKGFNYRMDGLQAAILRVKLQRLETWTEARRAHAARYAELLAGCGVELPQEMPYARHVYHVYAIRARGRDALRQKLAAGGVETGIHYPIPVHLQEAYADLGYRRGDFPCAERIAAEELSLPMYAELTEQQIEAVAREICR